MDINKRIKQFREKLDISQKDFGFSLGVSRSVINNIEREVTEVKEVFLSHICKVYNVNRTWLVSGEGEIFKPQKQEEKISEFILDILNEETPSFKLNLITFLSELDEDDWITLEKTAQIFAQIPKKEEDI